MNKVITVNLNGNAYQIDEDGYNALRNYIDRADAQLKSSVDRREVVADLEQAIGEKCANFLRPHKSVVTAAEIEQILKEIGPVQAADEPTRSDSQSQSQSPPRQEPANDSLRRPYSRTKRLYRIRQGSGWSGVCRGIAAYMDIDIVLVRILFVLGTFFTGGFGLLVYIVMIFLVPIAYTDEEIDEAHAVPPAYRRG